LVLGLGLGLEIGLGLGRGYAIGTPYNLSKPSHITTQGAYNVVKTVLVRPYGTTGPMVPCILVLFQSIFAAIFLNLTTTVP